MLRPYVAFQFNIHPGRTLKCPSNNCAYRRDSDIMHNGLPRTPQKTTTTQNMPSIHHYLPHPQTSEHPIPLASHLSTQQPAQQKAQRSLLFITSNRGMSTRSRDSTYKFIAKWKLGSRGELGTYRRLVGLASTAKSNVSKRASLDDT